MVSFDESYFIGGAESNYINYNDKRYEALALDIKEVARINKSDTVLDYGCATGILVKEMQKYCTCLGTDISLWAIERGLDNKVPGLYYYDKGLLNLESISCVIFLDVLEHCSNIELRDLFSRIYKNKSIKRLVVRIPVCKENFGYYILECSRKDKTHIQRLTKQSWRNFFNLWEWNRIIPISKNNIYDTEGVIAWKLERD